MTKFISVSMLIVLSIDATRSQDVALITSYPSCPDRSSKFSGSCLNWVDRNMRVVKDPNGKELLQRQAFYVDGRSAYPVEPYRSFLRSETICCDGSSCAMPPAVLMDGCYTTRDRKGRVWAVETYERGRVMDRVEYNGRSGVCTARISYDEKAWQLSDGVKVRVTIFKESDGMVLERYTQALENGRWKVIWDLPQKK